MSAPWVWDEAGRWRRPGRPVSTPPWDWEEALFHAPEQGAGVSSPAWEEPQLPLDYRKSPAWDVCVCGDNRREHRDGSGLCIVCLCGTGEHCEWFRPATGGGR